MKSYDEMKKLFKLILPVFLLNMRTEYYQVRDWKKRGYLENSPQPVKQKVFVKYGISNAQWVETGTYMGTTTAFLMKRFSFVHSIEPGLDLFNKAVDRFKGLNVALYNDVSENILPDLLPKLNGEINFWLDGHYSAGVTFKGDKDCPVEDELNAIRENLCNFSALLRFVE